MSRSEYAKELREKKMAAFEAKRQHAQSKMVNTSLRGQLGLSYKQFGELRNNLDKLKTSFDLIVQGTVSMQELDMLQSDDFQTMQISDKERLSE